MNKVYCSFENNIALSLNNLKISSGKLDVISVDNGIILPARRIPGLQRKAYEGGVCDEGFNFIAGFYRSKNRAPNNYACIRSYTPEEAIEQFDDEVVFVGMAIEEFGHFLTDSMARMWYVAHNSDGNMKIVFICNKHKTDYWKKYADIFEAINLKKENVIFLKKPAKFKRVIVPDQALYCFSSVHEAFFDIFDKMWEGQKSNVDKIYLSRSRLKDKDCFNESYFETFFEKNGYRVVHTQEMSFKDQVLLLRGATEIAATIGTLTHLLLFARPDVHCVELIRSGSYIPIMQMLIDKGKKISSSYVSVECSIFPQKHDELRCFYLAKTKDWSNFLKEQNFLSYDKDDREFDWSFPDFGDYIKSWVSKVSNNPTYKAKYDHISAADVIKKIALNANSLDIIRENVENKAFSLHITRSGKRKFSRQILLNANGAITVLEGVGHPNETTWQVSNGNLEILSENGSVTHIYDVADQSSGKINLYGRFCRNDDVNFDLTEL